MSSSFPAWPAWPAFADLILDRIELTEHQLTVHAATTTTAVRCPGCDGRSRRVHSGYTRTLADLPCSGLSVRLVLCVRRYFCPTSTCPRKTFVEQVPGLTRAHAQQTLRWQAVVGALGLALGGEAGQRLSAQLAMPTSAATILRRVRHIAPPAAPTPRVLGVDDWAKRKGQRYGTILVDLERHRPVDLLPDRTPESFAAWLEAHPGVEIVTRDRASQYADGATHGAPAAIQVADRWHLAHNLAETIQTLLERHAADLRLASETAIRRCAPDGPPAEGVARLSPTEPLVSMDPKDPKGPAVCPAPPYLTAGSAARESACFRHLLVSEVKALHAQGWSVRRIAAHLHLNRRTVRKYVLTECLARRLPAHVTSSVTPYQDYLVERWDAGCQQGTSLWAELRDQGYRGSLASVYRALRRLRPHPDRRRDRGRQTAAPGARKWSPRQAMWLLVRPPDALNTEQEVYRDALCARCPDAAAAYLLAQRFLALLRGRDATDFDPWLLAAEQSDVPELQRFAAGLRRDYAAVHAALTLPWSNGQVEGQVNRLKLLKRAMYGRASFVLLRLRVLAAA